MKQIELTHKQESKLFTMCKKVLAKDYKYFQFHNGKFFYAEPKDERVFLIHWFELIVTKLPQALFENFRRKWEESEEPFRDFSIDGMSFGSNDIVIQMINNLSEINPIDYLYDNVYKKYVK